MKAVVSRMSPHNVLSCCLKFCTASAHRTFSEASPPTYHLKGRKETEASDGAHRAMYSIKEVTGHVPTEVSVSHCVSCSPSNKPCSGGRWHSSTQPLLCAVHHIGCGMVTALSAGCSILPVLHVETARPTPGMLWNMFLYVPTQHSALSVRRVQKLAFSSFSSRSAWYRKIKSGPCALNNSPVDGKMGVNQGSDRRCVHMSAYKTPGTAEHISTDLAHIWETSLFLGEYHILLELTEVEGTC